MSRPGAISGAAFALDASAQIAPVWGDGSRVLAAQGEPTMICGPDGVGKTTIGQQVMLSRAGIGPAIVLGFPVAPDLDRKVLYLALDRPQQAARSLRRMAGEADRKLLQDRVSVWRGALPFDVVKEPSTLLAFARELGAGTVVIDSLKDVAPALSDEATRQGINKAVQLCVAADVEILSLHGDEIDRCRTYAPRIPGT